MSFMIVKIDLTLNIKFVLISEFFGIIRQIAGHNDYLTYPSFLQLNQIFTVYHSNKISQNPKLYGVCR